MISLSSLLCFFFNDTATTEIYTLSLHDALPILVIVQNWRKHSAMMPYVVAVLMGTSFFFTSMHLFIVNPFNQTVFLQSRSEEHTSELQSPCNLVCRLLLEKKKQQIQL